MERLGIKFLPLGLFIFVINLQERLCSLKVRDTLKKIYSKSYFPHNLIFQRDNNFFKCILLINNKVHSKKIIESDHLFNSIITYLNIK